ncbi:MAG: hypothetical protein ACO3GP_03480 [Candidatus Limnocylindrus sp.]
MTLDRTDALAALRRSALVRDDSGPQRVYRDPAGNVYFSVTSILGATADKSGLEGWAKRQEFLYGPGAAEQDRTVAATRGTQAHSQAEYMLKTANKVARSVANKRGSLRTDPHGLPHIPTPIFRWALAQALPSVPAVSLSAKGFARSLTTWIASNVTQCHACEFSIHHPAGFAGTADGLISVDKHTLAEFDADPALAGSPFIADWKTSNTKRSPEMMADYCLQAGAYSLGLEHLTGIQPAGAFIVVARRIGEPNVTFINRDQLVRAQDGYLERCRIFYEAIQGVGP